MDFRKYIQKAEEALNEKLDELDASIKRAKETEIANLEKRDELKVKERELASKAKEVEQRIAKLEQLEIIKLDADKQADRENEIERKERHAKKMLDDAATMKLDAERELESARKVVEKANKEKAEIEAKILERFKSMVIGK